MIATVLIEPALLAIPPMVNSQSEVESIIDRLMLWSRLSLSSDAVLIAQHSDTTAVLGEANCWPSKSNVEALLQLWGLDSVYSALDVSRVINEIMDRAHQAVDVLGHEIEQVDDFGTLDAVPYETKELRAAGARAIASVAAGFSRSHVFLAPADPAAISSIVFRGTVNGAKVRSDSVTLPFSVFGKVRTAVSREDVTNSIHAIDAWNSANEAHDFHFAISLKVLEAARGAGVPLKFEDLPTFHIGSGFAESLRTCQAGPNSAHGKTTLEACARIVGGHHTDLDPFMDAPRSRASEQRRRDVDDAACFRLHLFKSHEALRLMIWRRKDGTFEFDIVCPKANETLPRGMPQHAVSRSWS